MEKSRKVFEGSDEAGYIDPNKTEEENYYSYAYATGLHLDPTRPLQEHIYSEPDSINQVETQVGEEPSIPPAPSPPPCFFIPDLRTGIKVWFSAIIMTLITIVIGVILILYSPGKTIFKCIFYLMIIFKVCDWKFIEESVFTHAEK